MGTPRKRRHFVVAHIGRAMPHMCSPQQCARAVVDIGKLLTRPQQSRIHARGRYAARAPDAPVINGARFSRGSRMNNRIFSWCTVGMRHRCAHRRGTHHAHLRENSGQDKPKRHYDELWFAGLVCLPVFKYNSLSFGEIVKQKNLLNNPVVADKGGC